MSIFSIYVLDATHKYKSNSIVITTTRGRFIITASCHHTKTFSPNAPCTLLPLPPPLPICLLRPNISTHNNCYYLRQLRPISHLFPPLLSSLLSAWSSIICSQSTVICFCLTLVSTKASTICSSHHLQKTLWLSNLSLAGMVSVWCLCWIEPTLQPVYITKWRLYTSSHSSGPIGMITCIYVMNCILFFLE